MRDSFHADLDALNDQLIEMSRSVAEAIRGAGRVLLDSDTARASEVIAGDEDINELQFTVDDRVTEIMTQRQAVATDLRFILSAIRIAIDLERMGDMAKHVAKIARKLGADGSLVQTRVIFESMDVAAQRIADKTIRVLETRDQLDATQLEYDDDEMDALYSRLLGELASQWTHGAEAAVDVAMLGRSYERYADHAVRVGHQVVYLVTGEIHLDRPQ